MVLTITVNPSIDETWFLDTFDENDINRICRRKAEAGGKGINISRMLASLGEDTVAEGFAGGENGRLLRALLEREGVAFDLVETGINTRRNTTIQVADGHRTIKVNEAGEKVPLSAESSLFAKLLSTEADVIVVSGKFTPGFDKSSLISCLLATGKPVIADSVSLRIDDIIRLHPALIKPNIDELAEMLDIEKPAFDMLPSLCRQLTSRGIGAVAVSMGADGLFYYDGERSFAADAPCIDVRSTVGAGDCTVAGFALGMEKHLTSAETLLLAASFGTAMATTEGTSIPASDTINDIRSRITVSEM